MFTNNIDKLAQELELQEFEANGNPSPQVYAKLLAIYLYQNDLCSAKYLWKRIPSSVKLANVELSQIWTVGQRMWQRDYPSVYKLLVTTTWSDQVSDIMKGVLENVRNRAINLITQAYSSISLENVAAMTGLTEEETTAACAEKGWNIEQDTNMVHPVSSQSSSSGYTSNEDQLYKLTEFVSFLEN